MSECHKEDKTPPEPFRNNFSGFGQNLVGHLKCTRLDGNQDNSMRLKHSHESYVLRFGSQVGALVRLIHVSQT